MRVVSLFSGAGGLDLGLIQAGHEIIWANDNDPDAVNTYKINVGDHCILGDIENILDSEIPKSDIVVGGFPCQGFSLANMKRSGDDSRNKLYLQFLRVVTLTKPPFFLAENVKGILSLEGGEAIKKIINDFESAGYHVKYKLFNTANFGVPQTRSRVIIFGTRNDIQVNFEFPLPTHSKVGAGLPVWVNVSEAIEKIPDPDLYPNAVPNQIYSRYKITNRNFTGHRTTDPSKPSPTILARGNGGGGVCAIQHPNGKRRLSVRESASIQTFPENFTFLGSMNSQYRQVGNAVPVKFAKTLGMKIKDTEKLLRQVKK